MTRSMTSDAQNINAVNKMEKSNTVVSSNVDLVGASNGHKRTDSAREVYDNPSYDNGETSDGVGMEGTIPVNREPKEVLSMEPLWICRWMVNWPVTMFLLFLAIHCGFYAATAALYWTDHDIFPVDFNNIPVTLHHDDTVLRAAAWHTRKSDPNRLQRFVVDLFKDQPAWIRGFPKTIVELFYETKDNGNIFTRDNLKMIQDIEGTLFGLKNYSRKFCQINIYAMCTKPLSVLRFFDGTYKNIDKIFDDRNFMKIPKVLKLAQSHNETNEALMHHLSLKTDLEKDVLISDITRSFVHFGWPLDILSSGAQMNQRIDHFLKNEFKQTILTLQEKYRGKIGFYFYHEELYFDDVKSQALQDMNYAFGSLAFILFFILLHTRSLWISCWSVFSMGGCFFATNIIYRYVIGYRYFGFLHILSVFIILGIGADDIFIFFDIWRGTGHRQYPSLIHRFSHCYRRSAGAMFATSLTTMVAFLISGISPLLMVQSFGIFTGLLVLTNYLSVITFFPAVIITYHLKIKKCFKKACCQCCCRGDCCCHDNLMVDSGNSVAMEDKNACESPEESLPSYSTKGVNENDNTLASESHDNKTGKSQEQPVKHCDIQLCDISNSNEGKSELSSEQNLASFKDGQSNKEGMNEDSGVEVESVNSEIEQTSKPRVYDPETSISKSELLESQNSLQNGAVQSKTSVISESSTDKPQNTRSQNSMQCDSHLQDTDTESPGDCQDKVKDICTKESNPHDCQMNDTKDGNHGNAIKDESFEQANQTSEQLDSAQQDNVNDKCSESKSTPDSAQNDKLKDKSVKLDSAPDYSWTCGCRWKRRKHFMIRFFEGPYYRLISHRTLRFCILLMFVGMVTIFAYFCTKIVADEEELQAYKPNSNYGKSTRMRLYSFKLTKRDRHLRMYMIWGLKKQNVSICDYKNIENVNHCKGETVWDEKFDINVPGGQEAMLKLCEKLHSLPEDRMRELRIKMDETGVPMIDCFMTDMLRFAQNAETDIANKMKYLGMPFKPLNVSVPFDKRQMTMLMSYYSSMYNISALPDDYGNWFEVALGYWMTNQLTFKVTDDFLKYNDLLGEKKLDITQQSSGLGMQYGTKLQYAAVVVSTDINARALGYPTGLPLFEKWEQLTQQLTSDLPAGLDNSFLATPEINIYHWLKIQKSLSDHALMGLGLGIALAFPVLVLGTQNIIVGILATLSITLSTVCVVGIISVAGWKLGVLESLNLCVIIGLSIDYEVHLAEAYYYSNKYDRKARTKQLLGEVGLSVFSGALTTLGAAFFMLFAELQFYLQFGVFMFCTIGFSILFGLAFFTTTLALIGPQGECGSLAPLWRKLKACCTVGRKESFKLSG